MEVCHLGQIVFAVELGIQAIGTDPGGRGQLAVNKLGGVLIPVGKFAAQDRREGGHHRGSHGSTAEVAVLIAGEGGHDVLTGGIQLIFHAVEGKRIPVGKDRLSAGLVHAHNAQHVGQGRGIVGYRQDAVERLIGRAAVTGRCHQHAAGVSGCQGILHRDGAGRAAEGHIDDLSTVFIGIQHRLDDIRLVQGAVVHGRLDGHDLDVIGNAQHAGVVVAGSNDTGNVGAVTVGVAAVARAGNDIHTIVIVDVAIAVVVIAVVRDLPRVDPHVVLQVLMGIVHTGVDDRNHHTGAAALGLHLAKGIGDAAVVHMPLVLMLPIFIKLVLVILVEMLIVVKGGYLDLIVILRKQRFVQLTDSLQRRLGGSAVNKLRLIPGSAFQRYDLLQRANAGGLQAVGQLVGSQLDQNALTGELDFRLLDQLGIDLVEGLCHSAVFIVSIGVSGNIHGRLPGIIVVGQVDNACSCLLAVLVQKAVHQRIQLLVGQVGGILLPADQLSNQFFFLAVQLVCLFPKRQLRLLFRPGHTAGSKTQHHCKRKDRCQQAFHRVHMYTSC